MTTLLINKGIPIDILKNIECYLVKYDPYIHTFDDLAKQGNLDGIKWLHKNRTEGCTKYAMDWAASNGHLEVVKWLHKNRIEGCTTIAMDWAASNGHLEAQSIAYSVQPSVRFWCNHFTTSR